VEIGENEIPYIANIFGCKINWLFNVFDILKEKLEKKASRRGVYKERRNKYFCKLYVAHEKYAASILYEEKVKYFLIINEIKEKIANLSLKIKSINLEASHIDIANILGIPKGSVDSGLFYLKIYIEKNFKKSDL
jgi:hypothetical protein